MKGTIFCEFINMTEEEFGYEMVDKIISASSLPNDGAYTSVGTYDFAELVSLITNLSEFTNTPVQDLLYSFGKYLFTVFLYKYPDMFSKINDGFSLLEIINDKIHVEVMKLYPDAELPVISTKTSNNVLTMRYSSTRKMGNLAKGLINGCMGHFNEKIKLEEQFIEEDGTVVEFTIHKLS